MYSDIDAPRVKSRPPRLELIRALETRRKPGIDVDEVWVRQPNASKER
jgi:hypothetical protein